MKRILRPVVVGLVVAATTTTLPNAASADSPPSIDGFWLVDAEEDSLLDYVEPGAASFERAFLPDELSLRADASPTTESVMWQRDGDAAYQLENQFPYALNGDADGDYQEAPFALGLTSIAATAYSEDSQGGVASHEAEITISLYESDFVVNTTADTHDNNPGDGVCSIGDIGGLSTGGGTCGLRAAIEEANALKGAQSISIDGRAGIYTLHNGPLYINDSVTLRGYRMPRITADEQHKVFGVGFGGDDVLATFQGLRIMNGDANHDERLDTISRGGGISALNGSMIQVFDSIIESNRGNFGGGIYLWESSMLMRRSAVRDNIGGTPDDGIDGGGATQRGGGIRMEDASATIEDSSIHSNWAVRGGGLSIQNSSVKMTNTSVINNRAEAIGGGMEIHSSGTKTVAIAFSTIARNEAGASDKPPADHRRGGGIWNSGGRVQIGNSILAENTDAYGPDDDLHAPDCYSPNTHHFTSMRGNVVGVLNNNCVMLDTNSGNPSGFSFGTEGAPLDPGFEDVEVGPNGVRGISLTNSSVAVNHGTGVTSATLFDCPEHDAFGQPRPVAGSCDAGALERQEVKITSFTAKTESNRPGPTQFER